jgi:hypothetical protein
MNLRSALLAFVAGVLLSLGPSQSTDLYYITGQGILPQESAGPTVPSVDDDMFYVNIELLVFEEEIALYPETYAAFHRAIMMWSSVVPVRWVLHLESQNSPISARTKPGLIRVVFADLQGPGFDFKEGLIGYWDADNDRVLIDADSLESVPERAYSVALHELGHLFGVPHIIGMEDVGYTSFAVLPAGKDAKNFVMFPTAIKGLPQNVLSPIEIKLARHGLLYYWTIPGARKEDCGLTEHD